jgi:hypothetical protein
VPIQATTSASPGHFVAGWWIYVDNVGVYNGGAVSTIYPKVAMSAGTHKVVVRAWDSSGNFGDQTLTLTVNTTKPAVKIVTPSNNATAGSPVNLRASATPSSGQTITGWWVYVDSKATYHGGATKAININLKMSTGKHKVVVRAWDTSGNYGDHTIAVAIH